MTVEDKFKTLTSKTGFKMAQNNLTKLIKNNKISKEMYWILLIKTKFAKCKISQVCQCNTSNIDIQYISAEETNKSTVLPSPIWVGLINL